MIEVQIYARGLREMDKILELDRHLVEIVGLRYKMDTITISFTWSSMNRHCVREIRAIFFNLGLQPLFIGAIPTELQSRTKTERLIVGNAIGDE